MARKPRFENVSEGDVYHVSARGAGRRAIFEDDADRVEYLQALFGMIDETSGALLAWCLMDNHVHLLFRFELHELSSFVQRLHTKYAQYFNGRHGHVGPVFQGRFDCVAVKSDAQLLVVTRYIHRNPAEIGNGNWREYPWSSYRGYAEGMSHCETDLVLDLAGGRSGFEAFHNQPGELRMVELGGYGHRMNDAEARDLLVARFGIDFADILASLPKDKRDRELAIACHRGLSVRQLERLTGIGRGIISRAVANS